MYAQETLEEFYRRYGHGLPATQQVAAYRITDAAAPTKFPHIRRNFYKIKLLCDAEGTLFYANQSIVVRQPALIFANPLLPHSWKHTAGRRSGFACLFTDEFITSQLKTASVAGSPLFRVGGTPVLFPPPETVSWLSHLFAQILLDLHSAYTHKYEVVRSYVQLILHESLKLAPTAPFYQPATAAARLAAQFLKLLDEQFLSPKQGKRLRNVSEFAEQLAVHPNQLNKALREVTGKAPTVHIAEKLMDEAKNLLRHSTWSVAEISYSLGFEYASNFNSFFKKHAGIPPNHYRQQLPDFNNF